MSLSTDIAIGAAVLAIAVGIGAAGAWLWQASRVADAQAAQKVAESARDAAVADSLAKDKVIGQQRDATGKLVARLEALSGQVAACQHVGEDRQARVLAGLQQAAGRIEQAGRGIDASGRSIAALGANLAATPADLSCDAAVAQVRGRLK